jgi:hypothetical protein
LKEAFMPFGIGGGHLGGQDHARMRAEFHHRKFETQQRQEELNKHHNVALAQEEGERHRSGFVVRVLRRLFGRF